MLSKVAVTGASGVIGLHLVARLEEAGYPVVKFSRAGNGEGFFAWDMMNEEPNDTCSLNGVEVMYHLAAYIPPSFEDLSEALKCNTLNGVGTLNALKACVASGVRQFVYISGANLIKKDSHGQASEFADYDCSYALPYFASKALGEIYVRDLNTPEMIKNIVRPTSIYSESRPPALVRYMVGCIDRGEKIELFGHGEFIADYLHADDLALALVAALKSGLQADFNIGSDRPVTALELARYICKRRGLDPAENIEFVEHAQKRPRGGFGVIQSSTTVYELNPSKKTIFEFIDALLGSQ